MAEHPGTGGWRRAFAVATVLALLVTALSAIGLTSGAMIALRQTSTDAFLPRGATDPRIVVVAFDAATLSERPWPWTRTEQAELLGDLTRAGAAVVAYDIVFDAPARDDAVLAAAIAAHGNVVLATAGPVVRQDPLYSSTIPVMPSSELATAAAALGHVSVINDPRDNAVRTLPAAVEAGRDFVPALALAAAARLEQQEPRVTLRPTGVQVGSRVYPTQANGLLELNYTRELSQDTAPPVVSVRSVLRGDHAALLRGALVFVGIADPLLGDHEVVPVRVSGGLPGVLVHANAANTALQELHRAPISRTGDLAVVFALAFLAALLSLVLRLRWAAVTGTAVIAGYFAASLVAYDSGFATDLVYPVLGVVLAVVAVVSYRYLTEYREHARIAELFGQYVPREVARELLASGRAQAVMEGHRADIVPWFCDLRGFTAIAAQLEPGQVRELLSVFYEHATNAVLDHGGTLMQYVGDEVFAVFGAPIPQDDRAQRALDAAIAAQHAIPAINAELETKGLPPIAFGIGLHEGPVVAAHVGGGLRRQYSVIGDAVNVGARLCSMADRGQITISGRLEGLLEHVPELEPVGVMNLKGVQGDPRISRVIYPGITDEARVGRLEGKTG